MSPAVGSMAAILGNITSLVTSAVSWIGSYIGVITANPFIMLFIIMSVVGLGIGLLSRLLHL